jgi:hypothetical protein
MKITVKLNHAMARDRDAIESIFNRGMGRIYQLPDGFKASADYQTVVDKNTDKKVDTGYMPNARMGILYKEGLSGRNVSAAQMKGVPLSMAGSVSVWNRGSFNLGISENSSLQIIQNQNDIFKSAYRTADWIAQKSV